MLNNLNKDKMTIYGKQDIMELFKCESDKALRLLKLMFQMKEANKIGREYYIDHESLMDFLERFKGEEISI